MSLTLSVVDDKNVGLDLSLGLEAQSVGLCLGLEKQNWSLSKILYLLDV